MGLTISTVQGLSLKNIAVILIIAALIVSNSVQGRTLLARNSLNVPIILFVAYALVSIFVTGGFGHVPNYSISHELILLKSQMDAFVVLIVAYNLVHDIKKIKTLIYMLLGVFLIFNIIGILGSFGVLQLPKVSVETFGRSSGAMGEANQSAAYISIFMPLATALLMESKSVFVKIILVFISVLGFFALLFTGSRGGILATFVGYSFFFLLNSKRFSMIMLFKMIAFWAFILILGVSAFVLLPEESRIGLEQNILGRAGSDATIEDYSSGRLIVWKVGMELFASNPIFGTGWRTFSQLAGANSHNEYLLYLATGGIVGFYLFMLIFWRLAKSALYYRQITDENAIFYNAYLGGLFSLMTALMFVNLYSPYMFFFIYSALILKMGFIEQNDAYQRRFLSVQNAA